MSPPLIDGRSGILEIGEPVQVEAVFSELAIEALDEGVLRRLSGLDEVQLHARLAGPEEHGLARQLGAVVADDGSRQALAESAEFTRQALPGDRQINDLQDAFARGVVDDAEQPEAAPIAS